MKYATPEYLLGTKAGKNFPGSMGPKIQAAIDFVQNSTAAGNPNAWAAIGDLKDASKIMSNQGGTIVKNNIEGDGVVWRPSAAPAAEPKPKKESLSTMPLK